MKKKKAPLQWNPISWTSPDGTVFNGAYALEGRDLMTVRLDGGGQKSARSGPAAAGVAKIILGELVRENRR